MKGFAARASVGTLTASIFVSFWARQLSVPGFLSWLLVLALPGAFTATVMWLLSRRGAPSVGVRLLAGLASGISAIYVEALICSAFRPDLFPDPMAPSNLVPGVVIGVFVPYVAVGLGTARQAMASSDRR